MKQFLITYKLYGKEWKGRVEAENEEQAEAEKMKDIGRYENSKILTVKELEAR